MSSIKNVKISVRHLVEFVLRSGDLISVFTGSSRLVDGGKIHRKLQQSQGTEYRAEVSLSLTVERPGVILQIGGRADGVIITRDEAGDEQVTVDEIKSISAPLEMIGQGHNPQHWAQAKCYAFIYAQQEGLREITVQLTYCQAATLEIKTFQHRYSVAELAAFFDNLVTQYAHWAARIAGWTEIRDTAARRVEFPFASFRAGQRQLAVAVYKTLSAERKLFAQAPTGTGKTMAAIFPAIKALGRGTVERIFYLTAKTVTRQLAEEAFKRLRQAGLRLKTVTLTAKEKICFLPGAACTPEECPYAQGYYDRIGQALTDCWELEAFTREMIEEQARRHRLCPFAFSLDLAWWADAVICDYNYVFDPGVYLKRFFDENSTGNCLLVDEAHNLVDRAREMFSAEITKQPFLALKKRVRERLPGLAKNMGKINSFLGKTGKLCREKSLAGQPDYWVGEQPLTEINPLLREFLSLAEAWLTYNEPADFRQELLDLYFAVYAFLRTAELYDARYVTYAEKGEKDVKLTYFCVDPSHLLRQAAARGRTAVFFSATLAPLDYFGEMLGGEGEDGKIACL
ncbi:MAG TPA: DEAD/DEAH box helicase, partial [Negativicutes bacterium]|nr:DEAD/DEAH box helicase [Negativicutes bacterium]